jgi:crotonobetainyl-CoA:carnitine CoA-transferase CaiB-like acyl-CoA transferase
LTSTPLNGLRVLDLTRLLPGPFCTMILADLGADVIKVEEPGTGDPARHYPPLQGDTGSLFLLVNRNKRGIVLDLKTELGKDLLLRLVDGSDVLVEGFRPGVMDRLGLGYSVLSERNPRLIYASLSGFGPSGPYRDRPGHDLNYLALAGVLGYNVDLTGAPVVPAVQVADLGAGTLAAVAILAAVLARQQSGQGQAVDVSLFGTAIAWLPTLICSLFATGRSARPREPRLAGRLPQYDVYATADDRYVSLGALEPRFLANFLQIPAVDRIDLLPLAAAQTEPDREAFRAELRKIFASRTLAEWIALLDGVDTCFAPVQTLEETVQDAQVQALNLIQSVDHPRLGALPQLAPPFTFSTSETKIRRPAPDLGEHTEEILRERGIAADA